MKKTIYLTESDIKRMVMNAVRLYESERNFDDEFNSILNNNLSNDNFDDDDDDDDLSDNDFDDSENDVRELSDNEKKSLSKSGKDTEEFVQKAKFALEHWVNFVKQLSKKYNVQTQRDKGKIKFVFRNEDEENAFYNEVKNNYYYKILTDNVTYTCYNVKYIPGGKFTINNCLGKTASRRRNVTHEDIEYNYGKMAESAFKDSCIKYQCPRVVHSALSIAYSKNPYIKLFDVIQGYGQGTYFPQMFRDSSNEQRVDFDDEETINYINSQQDETDEFSKFDDITMSDVLNAGKESENNVEQQQQQQNVGNGNDYAISVIKDVMQQIVDRKIKVNNSDIVYKTCCYLNPRLDEILTKDAMNNILTAKDENGNPKVKGKQALNGDFREVIKKYLISHIKDEDNPIHNIKDIQQFLNRFWTALHNSSEVNDIYSHLKESNKRRKNNMMLESLSRKNNMMLESLIRRSVRNTIKRYLR